MMVESEIYRRPAQSKLSGDRRVKTVALTSRGVRLRASLVQLISEPPEMFVNLMPAEQRQLRDLLLKLLPPDAPLTR